MGFLDSIGNGLKNIANGAVGDLGGVVKNAEAAAKEVQQAFDSFKDDASLFNQTVASLVKNPSSLLDGGKLPGPLGNLSLDALNLLEKVLPQPIHDPAGDQLKQQTTDFRNTATTIRNLQSQLAGMKPTDPKYASTQAQLSTASTHMQSISGYTAATLPKPGTLWLAPEFGGDQYPNGQITSSKFPVGTPVTQPETPANVLFPNGQNNSAFNLRAATGQTTPVTNMQQYEAQVAAARTAAGIAPNGGQPQSVNVTFQGGGGKGKRYAPALEEMLQLGIVPGTVSGASAGSIAAGLVAAGADPAEIDNFVKSPVISTFMDWDISPNKGGVMDGQAAYNAINAELAKLTGITDRPVTFADLKMPLQIVACKMSDNDPNGQKDLSDPANRTFVFSQATTPNTPVALAIRASMSIPGAFDPVQAIDPTTGREVDLVDGGTIDNLPLGLTNNKLPTVALSLYSQDSNHPDDPDNTAKPEPLPSGNLDTTHLLWNALNSYTMNRDAADDAQIFQVRNNPPANTFVLSLPTWNLDNPSQGDSTMSFGYNNSVDPAIDAQTRQVTQNFFKQFMGSLGTPGASGTNVTDKLPPKLTFNQSVTYQGQTYQGSYTGGDDVVFTSPAGKKISVPIGQQKIEAMWLDNQSFHDLSAQLGQSFSSYMTSPNVLGVQVPV